MKVLKNISVAMVFTVFLWSAAFGQIQDDNISEPKPDIALEGIKRIGVSILTFGNEPRGYEVDWKSISDQTEKSVADSGIEIISPVGDLKSGTGELKIYVDMLEVEDSNRYVFRIQTSIARKVFLPGKRRYRMRADIWHTKAVMKAVLVDQFVAEIAAVAAEQVKQFVGEWTAANARANRPSRTTKIKIAQNQQRSEKYEVAFAAAIGNKYVASKNSKVFHKAICSSAERIARKNIVKYAAKVEAVNAGKRPCKICKP